MSGNAQSVVETAPALAPPEQHAEKINATDDDGFIDLDAGNSLLDEKPDDGRDISSEPDAPAAEEQDTEDEAEPEKDASEEPEESDEELLNNLSDEQTEKPKKPSGSARLKAQLAELKEENARLRQSVPKTDTAADLEAAIVNEIGARPKESDFEDYLAFQNASIAYDSAKIIVARELKKASEHIKATQERELRVAVEIFNERVADFSKSVPDFRSVMEKATVAPAYPEVIAAIRESEQGPAIAYHLAKHPSIVSKLDEMPLHRALVEIGKLEATLRPAPQKQTKAPEPVKPLRSGSKVEDVNPEKLPDRKFDEWYDRRLRSRGR